MTITYIVNNSIIKVYRQDIFKKKSEVSMALKGNEEISEPKWIQFRVCVYLWCVFCVSMCVYMHIHVWVE